MILLLCVVELQFGPAGRDGQERPDGSALRSANRKRAGAYPTHFRLQKDAASFRHGQFGFFRFRWEAF